MGNKPELYGIVSEGTNRKSNAPFFNPDTRKAMPITTDNNSSKQRQRRTPYNTGNTQDHHNNTNIPATTTHLLGDPQ